MLTLYLAALVLGLGMFLVQLFGSSDAGHSAEGVPLLGSDLDHGADLGAALAPGPGADLAHAHGGGHASGVGGLFLSLRFYMFAALGFGAVGAPVTAFGASPAWLTLLVALGTGLIAGCLAAFGFRALGRESLSSNTSPAELRGQVGRVLIACGKGRRGKVRLTIRGQIVDFVATTDDLALEPGCGVIVEELRQDSVHVCAAPRELLPE